MQNFFQKKFLFFFIVARTVHQRETSRPPSNGRNAVHAAAYTRFLFPHIVRLGDGSRQPGMESHPLGTNICSIVWCMLLFVAWNDHIKCMERLL